MVTFPTNSLLTGKITGILKIHGRGLQPISAWLQETLAITAFIHTLAHWFADHGSWLESVNYPPRWLSRENKWRVIRYGLDADLVMNTDGKTKLLRDDIKEWVEKLQPYAQKLGIRTTSRIC